MSFTLHPAPGSRALRVPPGPPVFTAFAARSAPVAELDPPYSQVMFIRVAVLSPGSRPELSVAAGTGAPVEVSPDPQGVFRSTGDQGYVGDVWCKTVSDNVVDVMVGLVAIDAGLGWRLGIKNTDGVAQDVTWVVADRAADLAQSWVDAGSTFRVSATVPVGAETRLIAVDPATHRVYVTVGTVRDQQNSGVAIIEPGRPPTVRIVKFETNLIGIALGPTPGTVYVSNGDTSSVVLVDTATGSAVWSAGLGAMRQSLWLAVDAAAKQLYAATIANTVSVVDTAAGTVVAAIDARATWGLALDTRADLLYTAGVDANRHGCVSVIDTNTRQITRVIEVDSTDRDVLGNLALDAVGNSLYVADSPGGRVWRIDTATGTVAESIAVGREPIGLAFERASYTLLAGNTRDNTISVIDTRTNTVRQTLTVGGFPFGIAVDPVTRARFVTSLEDSAVSILEPT